VPSAIVGARRTDAIRLRDDMALHQPASQAGRALADRWRPEQRAGVYGEFFGGVYGQPRLSVVSLATGQSDREEPTRLDFPGPPIQTYRSAAGLSPAWTGP
jgi:hypothetical protein